MKLRIAIVLVTAAVAVAGQIGGAEAGHRQFGLRLACDNGRTYPIEPRAISDEGDLVTGYIRLRHHRHVPIRLIPMGEGYRYAGLGVWLDGVAGDAVLNWGKTRAVACNVQQG